MYKILNKDYDGYQGSYDAEELNSEFDNEHEALLKLVELNEANKPINKSNDVVMRHGDKKLRLSGYESVNYFQAKAQWDAAPEIKPKP